MKYFLLILTAFTSLHVLGQVKVSQGSNSPQFVPAKQPGFSSFSTDEADYFVIKRSENFERINTLIVADKSGNITSSKEARVNMGLINNTFDVKELLVLGKKPLLFVENHNKADGKNTLSTRTVDKNGNVSATGPNIGSIDFQKMSNAGEWHISLTPDKKHVAVIGKVAAEKNTPEVFKYFILDEELKELNKGQFSFVGNPKPIVVSNFMASDKGDLYIISEEFDKSYKFPTLYKYSADGQTNIIPVMISDPGLKNLSYTLKVNPAGNLIIAGYMQKKSGFSMGDIKAVGTWLFNSEKPSEVKTFNFEQAITNLTARNLVFNGDTFYLIGEQYKSEKQPITATGMARLNAPEVFDYFHEDIIVTGYSADGNKKFEMPVSRKWKTTATDQQFMIASGIINGKLGLIYNDLHGKYIDDKYNKHLLLPVALLITNDGLMEAPVNFAKELDVKLSSYVLSPQFFSAAQDKLVVLSLNAQAVKTITFQ